MCQGFSRILNADIRFAGKSIFTRKEKVAKML